MRRDRVALRRAPRPWDVARPIYRAVVLCLLLVLGSATASASAGAKSGYAEIGALRIYYEVHGEGAPLLILHGGGSTIGTSFGAILPDLAKAHMVVAPEQQGHGHTADLDRPLSYRQMADDTAALVKRLGLRKIDVLGFSNGGGVAIELAIRMLAGG